MWIPLPNGLEMPQDVYIAIGILIVLCVILLIPLYKNKDKD